MDVKTLRRTVEILKSMSLLVVYDIRDDSLGRLSTRTFITIPSITPSSDEFVELMKNPAGSRRYKQDVEAQYFDSNKYDYGFVSGCMERAKLLHMILMEHALTNDNWIVNIKKFVCEHLKLKDFLVLFGSKPRICQDLYNACHDALCLESCMEKLPDGVRVELTRMSLDQRRLLDQLVTILTELGLLLPLESDLESTLRSPNRLSIQREHVALPCIDRELGSKYSDFRTIADVHQYWLLIREQSRPPEDLDTTLAHCYIFDVRNWSFRPIRKRLITEMRRRAERHMDDEDEAILRASLLDLSMQSGVQFEIVSMFVHYYADLIQASKEAIGEEAVAVSFESGQAPSLVEKSFSVEDTHNLLFIVTLFLQRVQDSLDVDKIPWSLLSLHIPGHSADECRRKYANVLKSDINVKGIDTIHAKICRVDELSRLGLIETWTPSSEISSLLSNMSEYYRRMFDSLPVLEEQIRARSPRSLTSALTTAGYTMSRIAAPRDAESCIIQTTMSRDTENHHPNNILEIRQRLVHMPPLPDAMLQIWLTRDDIAHLNHWVELDFLSCREVEATDKGQKVQCDIALSDRMVSWLTAPTPELCSPSSAFQSRQPLRQDHASSVEILDLYRLSSEHCITLKPSALDIDSLVDFELVVTEPMMEHAHDTSRSSLWWSTDGELSINLFRKCLCHVVDLLADKPGTVCSDVRSSILTTSEILECLHFLEDHDYLCILSGKWIIPIV